MLNVEFYPPCISKEFFQKSLDLDLGLDQIHP